MSRVVTSEEEARTEVRQQAEAGVNFVKVYETLGPELMRVVVVEAHQRGIRVLAHLGATSWKQAAEIGVDGIVHVNPAPEDLLSGSEPGFPKRSPDVWGRSNAALAVFRPDSPAVRELFVALRSHGIATDPTLAVLRNFESDPGFINAIQGKEMATVPEFMREGWEQELSVLFSDGYQNPEQRERVLHDRQRFVREAHEAGVAILVGTDFANPNTLPGLSLHQEMELLVGAGIPASVVLRMATHDAAQWLGILDEVGTLEPGKQADLVILSGDPLEDIQNTRTIVGVVQAGRIIDQVDR